MKPDHVDTVPADPGAGIEVTTTAARGAASLTAAHGALMVAGYVVAVVLARELGPAVYGVYGLVYSVLLGVELIGRLGVPQALSRLVAEEGEVNPQLEGTGLTLTLVIHLPLFVAFWFLAPALGSLFQLEDGATLFRIAAIDIPFFGLYMATSHILNGHRSFAEESLGVMIYAAARVIGILILLLVGVTIAGALIVNAASSIVALAFVAWRVRITSLRLTLRHQRALVRLAVPIGLFALGSQLLVSLDLWSLNALGTQVANSEKGLYVAATNLARLANVAGFVMAAVLVPSVARALAEGDIAVAQRATRGAGRFLAVALIPMSAVVLAEASEIMTLVFSDEYRRGASLLAILVVSHGVFFTAFMSLCGILIGISRERDAAAIALAALPLAMIANLLLIRGLGAPGAALAAMVATGTAAAASGIRVRQTVGPILGYSELVRIILASLAVWALASWIRMDGALLLVELAGLAIAYLTGLYLMRVVGPEDVAPFRSKSR
jgi:O-antigen/teichoic acid export membrane protein